MSSVRIKDLRPLSLEQLAEKHADCEPGSAMDHAIKSELAYRSLRAQLECTVAQTEATKAMKASVTWAAWMFAAVSVSAVATAAATLLAPLVSSW